MEEMSSLIIIFTLVMLIGATNCSRQPGLEIMAGQWTMSGQNGFCLVKCLDGRTFCLVVYTSKENNNNSELFVQLNKIGNYWRSLKKNEKQGKRKI